MNEIKQQKISSLRGSERVRKRPSVIFGDNGQSGVSQAVFEMLSNCFDESRRGYGKKVTLIKHKDLSYSILDEGRGVPLLWNEEEQDYNFQLIFQRLYAGGNYENESTGDATLGTNGLGSTSTCYASEFFNVESKNNKGESYSVKFIKGRVVDKETDEFLMEDEEISMGIELGLKALNKETHNSSSGTTLHFRPDLEVFTEINVDLDWLKEKMKMQAVYNLGVEVILIDEYSENPQTYIYKFDSIEEYMKTVVNEDDNIVEFHQIKDSEIGQDLKDKPEYECKFDLGFVFNNKYEGEPVTCLHNSSQMISDDKRNVVYHAVKYGFLRAIEKLIKENNGYNSKDKGKISFLDIEDSLFLIINSSSSITSFSDQTKLGLNNPFVKTIINEKIKHHLDVYFTENKLQADIIMNQVLINFRARTKADETKKNLKKKFEKEYTTFDRPKKFVNCTSRDSKKRELYVMEGDSSLGSCKLARDPKFQAMMPIRGKILNCLKASYEEIFKSEIIVDLIKIMKCGVEINNKKYRGAIPEFDISKLDFDKIIITVDADNDGEHIKMLLLMMFYVLTPQLITNGYIYYVNTPLFEINCGKDTFFAYSDKERDSIVNKLGDRKYTIDRSKGLGENEPEMMSLTAMHPDTRQIVRITMDDLDSKLKDHLDTWMGDDMNGNRKDWVIESIEKFLNEGA